MAIMYSEEFSDNLFCIYIIYSWRRPNWPLQKQTYTLPLITFSIFFSLNLFYMSPDNGYLITEVWGYCVRSGASFCTKSKSPFIHMILKFLFLKMSSPNFSYWMEKLNINISEKVLLIIFSGTIVGLFLSFLVPEIFRFRHFL